MTASLESRVSVTYDSPEGILKSLGSWRQFWAVVRARREAAERHETLSWFLVWGQFELREDGFCLAWKPGLSGVTDELIGKEAFLQRGVPTALSISVDKYVFVPPAILRCLICGHIFRKCDSETITKKMGFLSLENFVGVSLGRAMARMSNPTNFVYGIPIRTTLVNGKRRVPLNLLDPGDCDRVLRDGDYLQVDFFRFSHDVCGSTREGASDRPAPVSSGTSDKERGRKCRSAERRSPSKNPRGNADEDAHRWYRKKMYAFRLLDAEEEQALAQRIQAGDMAAHRDLVHANLRLAYSVAYRFWRGCRHRESIELDDVVQEANMALLYVASRFQWKGYRFSAYAVVSIERYLWRQYTSLSGIVYVPPLVHWKCVQFSRALEIFLGGYDRGEAVARAAAKAGISMKMARNFAEMYMSGMIVPLEDDDDRHRSAYESIPDGSPPVEHLLADEECRGIIRTVCGSLADKGKGSILTDRIGLNSEGKEKTLKSIGQERGWSQERVWQRELLEKAALREAMRLKGYSRESFFGGTEG